MVTETVLYYGTSSRSYFSSNAYPTGITNAAISNLTVGIVYYFAATARNQYGVESEYSNEVVLTNQLVEPPSLPPEAVPEPVPDPAPDPVSVETNAPPIVREEVGGGTDITPEGGSSSPVLVTNQVEELPPLPAESGAVLVETNAPSNVGGGASGENGSAPASGGTVGADSGAQDFAAPVRPRFSAEPQHAAHGWKLIITGPPYSWIFLQRSSNLRDWEGIWSARAGAEGEVEADIGDAGEQMLFFRVVAP